MIPEIITAVLSTIVTIGITSLVTIKATRKKANAEADTTLYASLKSAFDHYKEMTDLTIKNLELRIGELEHDYKNCKEQLINKINEKK